MSIGRIFLVHKDEVELFLDEVGSCHLDGDVIAQAIHFATTTATDAVVLLVELIEIVIQTTDAYQTLAMRLVEFDIQAPLGHARDMASEHATQALTHEFDLLVLDRSAFGIGSKLLLSAHVLALVLEFDGVHTLLSCGILVQQTVYRQVGIAADGRSEVGIVVKRQTIVADVGRAIDSLGHRADSQNGEHFFLGFALGLLQHLVDGFIDILARALGTYLVAEVGGDVGKVLQFVQVGLVVDAIDKCLGGPVLGHLADMFSHLAVGEQHEFLDEFVGVLCHMDMDGGGHALLIDVKLDFLAVEGYRSSFLKAATPQLLCHLVEHSEFFGKVTFAGLEDVLCLLVGESPVAAGHRVANLIFLHPGFGIHFHNHRVGEFVLVGAQRADVVAQFLGQHGNGAVHQIHRGGTLISLLVDDGAGRYIVAHVSNVDADFPVAVFQFLD